MALSVFIHLHVILFKTPIALPSTNDDHFILFYFIFFPCAARPLCHDHESIALLQFKNSFVINKSASYKSFACPKTASWEQRKETRLLLSKSVKSYEETLHVTAPHLNSNCLYYSIKSSSNLFQLFQLQILNLANNDFNQCQILSAL
ncbi:hypothetical protein FEM48_Zijuj09G0230900 [Ziziphus jujuba var. spinosa]|uniref:Uncharacterized protein n=1 Tax=Ziziphus jujuba var. spinosa TaxID=714518 RepID=A0A978UVU8_ZIZJJ|nr:hypothetical protein FEM48_Zijuj09G0230900 [Ziziphus jujuba var. spinosa]